MSRPNLARTLPPGDRDDAPTPPPAPQAPPAPASALNGLALELDAIGTSLSTAAVAFAALTAARERGDDAAASGAAAALVAALQPDPRALARRVALMLDHTLSRCLRDKFHG